MDWFSRYVLSWGLSITMDVGFCLEALEQALSQGRPEIFNRDQGAQFTSLDFTGRLELAGVRISMDERVYLAPPNLGCKLKCSVFHLTPVVPDDPLHPFLR